MENILHIYFLTWDKLKKKDIFYNYFIFIFIFYPYCPPFFMQIFS